MSERERGGERMGRRGVREKEERDREGERDSERVGREKREMVGSERQGCELVRWSVGVGRKREQERQ